MITTVFSDLSNQNSLIRSIPAPGCCYQPHGKPQVWQSKTIHTEFLGDQRHQETYACGDVNTTLIKTALGRTITVHFDLVTPRPYSRINSICGTGGTFADYPPRLALLGKEHAWETDLTSYMDKYGHPLWKQHKEQALKSGGHGGMDYLMNWRLIQCLRAGSPLDMTVYDAAAWSSIFPLSVASVAKGSSPVSVPDFTRGQWQTPRPLLAGDVA